MDAGPDLQDAEGVFGREWERARVEAWLSAVEGGARALLVQGDSGIGKTTLWRIALQRWRRAGHLALVTRPAEEERSLALAGLIDLLEPVEQGAAELLADDDPLVRGRNVLSVLRSLTRQGPVLLAIDDVQWLDAPSARALRYALRRLDDEPLGVLSTARRGATPEDPLSTLSTLPPGRFESLTLGPLGLDAVRRVVGRVVTTISPRVLRRIHEVSGGNPMFALELARELASAGPFPTAEGVPRLPDSLQGAILSRLASVPAELTPLLEATSALGRTRVPDLRELLPDAELDGQLSLAGEAGLLVVGGDLEVRFSHPLIGSVVYARMSPFTRLELHARLAAQTRDPDLRAYHLARCTDEPDSGVASLLEEAAARASDHGLPGLAAELAEHSVRLTPHGDQESVRRRELCHVGYLTAAGEPHRALAIADRIVAALPPGTARAEALVHRAQLEDDDLERGEALLVQALDDAGDDAALRGEVLDQLGWLRGVFRGDLKAGIVCAREALDVAERVDDPAFEMSAAAGLSNMETLAGNPRPDLMARAVHLEDEIGRPPLWAGPRVLLAEQLLWAGDLSQARTLLEAAVSDATRRNHERWRPYSLYDLAAVESAAGNLHRADSLLAQALSLARDSEDAHVESWIFYRRALVSTWLGRASEARAAAARRLESAERRGERPGIARARSVLGLLALSEGDPTSAARELDTSAGLLEEMGFGHPGAIPALPDAIEAHALAGEHEAAAELLLRLEAQSARVGSAWVLAALDRARGVVDFAKGKGGAAVGSLDMAAREFTRLGFAPDAARANLLKGRALWRDAHRNAALDALTEAHEAFEAMGAALWAARAAEELDRVSPGRHAGRLTPAERRIAVLVAQGRKNREIAQALFMSVGTVEAHLTRVYRKLDISSRSELTRLVAEDAPELSTPPTTRDGSLPAP